MSSDILRQGDEDQYFYTSQYDRNQDKMMFSTDSMPHSASQASNDVPRTMQHHPFTNTYAFDSNSQYSISAAPYERPSSNHSQNILQHSSYQSAPTLTQSSIATPLALPGLLDTTRAQRSVIEPQTTRENPTSAVSANGATGERVEQNGSDLEEGELSEGTDRNSPKPQLPSSPPSVQQPSMYTSDTVAKEKLGNKRNDSSHLARRPDRSIQGAMEGKGQAASVANIMRTRQPHSLDSRMVHSQLDGHDESASPNLTSSRQRPRKPKKTSKAILQGAKRAVEQLRLHNIGYLQLVREHVDANLLKKIYAEMNITVPESTQSGASSSITRPQAVPSKMNLNLDLNQGEFAQNTTPPVITSGLESRQNPTSNVWLPHDQQRAREAKEPGIAPSNMTHVTRGGRNNNSNNLEIVPCQPPRDTVLPQTKTDTNNESPGTSSKQTMITPKPADNATKPANSQNITHRHGQASTITNTSKPPVPKAAPKPVDRKDYVARLLAAKAGKAVSTTDASKTPPNPAQRNSGQNPPLGVNGQAREADAVNASHTLNINVPNGAKSPSILATDATSQRNVAAEAKKREQTELARRRIEELKQRSEALKKAPSAATEAPPPAASASPSPRERLTQALTVRNSPGSTWSAFAPDTPQHSYFSSHDTAFTLPGLFMSSQPPQPKLSNEPVQVAPGSVESQQTEERKPVVVDVSDAVAAPHPSLPASGSVEPDSHDNTISEKAPVSESSTPRAINNPRKRPTALDFIEPFPAKISKLHSSRVENSVVFEVSDDEDDEIAVDASEMQSGREQGVKTTDAGELQASRPGSTEQAKLRQHPALSGPLGRTEPRKSTPSTPIQALQAPFKHPEPGGLRSNEEEIARMKRRIAEMEERRRSKQAASPAQMPRPSIHMVSSVQPVEGIVTTSSTPGPVNAPSDPASHVQNGHIQNDEGIPGDVLRSGSNLLTEVPVEQQMNDIVLEHNEASQPLEVVANESADGLIDQQRRRAEIESRIPSMSATVEEYMSKLQRLQQEQATLEAGLRREMDEQRALQEELDKILQASMSHTVISTQENDKAVDSRPVGHFRNANPDVSPREQQDEKPETNEPPRNVVPGTPPDDLTTKRTSASEPSTPKTAISIEIPTDQPLVNGELAEDVMDISGSEKESSSAEYSPEPNPRPSQSAMESDSEELYEPPQSFGPAVEDLTTVADSQQHQSNEAESLQQSTRGLHPLTLSGEASRVCNVSDDVEDNASVVLPPAPADHSPSPVEMSDSDGYEPPEPVRSVDVDPLTNDATSIDSQCSSPSFANQAVEEEIPPPEQLSTGKDQAVGDLAEAESYDPEQASAALSSVPRFSD
ncbi:MAG: hypothetical protein LQ345_004570 [Seirophora villosa]|nr:MAG: hypothetical protein LQ345_004570 [Seirophora villosa]